MMEDPNPFVSCPYNPTHRVLQSRIQGHIVKCQKNYPKLEICPYNATHRYPIDKIKDHVRNCETRLAVFPSKPDEPVDGASTKPTPVSQKDYMSDNDSNNEDWDD